jgi:hypothetical protein
MNATEKNIAVARGEALAALLIAAAALQTMLLALPKRLELLDRISAFVDNTLNISGPPSADSRDDELNTQMREVARFQTAQTLQEMERMIRSVPSQG